MKSGVFVVGKLIDASDVLLGSEVLSINDVSTSTIVARLKDYVPADGFNESWKRLCVNKKFPYMYALAYGYHDQFTVELRERGMTDVKNVLLEPVGAEAVPTDGGVQSDLHLQLDDGAGTAIMTIRSFAYYDNRDQFYSFVDDAFRTIRQRGIQNSILDIRGDDGGCCSSTGE